MCELSWVTCQLSDGRTRDINTELVQWVDQKGDSATVIKCLGEEPFLVRGGIEQWRSQVSSAESDLALKWGLATEGVNA